MHDVSCLSDEVETIGSAFKYADAFFVAGGAQ